MRKTIPSIPIYCCRISRFSERSLATTIELSLQRAELEENLELEVDLHVLLDKLP